MIRVYSLSGGYGKEDIIKDLSFTVYRGEFFGIVGPNGSGKSTLLRFLAGVLPTDRGEILFNERNLSQYTRKEIAKNIAVLPQENHLPFSYTVREVILMGRYPHQQGWFPSVSHKDQHIVEEILQLFQLKDFEQSPYMQLSGGQKQRVILARVLVQEPEVILLDEPTNHLDLHFQLDILHTLKKWQQEKGVTVISVLHDINLTSIYCDRVLVLESNGEMKAIGDPQAVLTPALVNHIFKVESVPLHHPMTPKPHFGVQPYQKTSENKRTLEDILHFEFEEDALKIKATIPLKTLSTTGIGGGLGWRSTYRVLFDGVPDRTDEVVVSLPSVGYKNVIKDVRFVEGIPVIIWLIYGWEFFTAFVFIDGNLSDSFMTQSFMAISSGIALDHLIIASTQKGKSISSLEESREFKKSLKDWIHQKMTTASH